MTQHNDLYIGECIGSSMEPLISAGDKIFANTTTENFALGDIIVYFSSGKLVCHRIIRFSTGKLLTKGDNVPFSDKLISKDAIIGKVIKIQHGKKTISFQRWEIRAVNVILFTYSYLSLRIPQISFRSIQLIFSFRNRLVSWIYHLS